MGVARNVVVHPVSNNTTGKNLLGDKRARQRDVLCGGEFDWQCQNEFLGQLGIGTLLENLDPVPERLCRARHGAVGDHCPCPARGIGRQHELFMDHARLARVVDHSAFALVFHSGAMPIGSRRDRAPAGTAADELGREVGDGQGRAAFACQRLMFPQTGPCLPAEPATLPRNVLLRPWSHSFGTPG